MSQMTWNGSCAATASTKSPGRPRERRRRRCRPRPVRMSSAILATTRGVNALGTMPRRFACRGSSRLTIESPNTNRTQPAGVGVVTPGPLMNTSGLRLASTTSRVPDQRVEARGRGARLAGALDEEHRRVEPAQPRERGQPLAAAAAPERRVGEVDVRVPGRCHAGLPATATPCRYLRDRAATPSVAAASRSNVRRRSNCAACRGRGRALGPGAAAGRASRRCRARRRARAGSSGGHEGADRRRDDLGQPGNARWRPRDGRWPAPRARSAAAPPSATAAPRGRRRRASRGRRRPAPAKPTPGTPRGAQRRQQVAVADQGELGVRAVLPDPRPRREQHVLALLPGHPADADGQRRVPGRRRAVPGRRRARRRRPAGSGRRSTPLRTTVYRPRTPVRPALLGLGRADADEQVGPPGGQRAPRPGSPAAARRRRRARTSRAAGTASAAAGAAAQPAGQAGLGRVQVHARRAARADDRRRSRRASAHRPGPGVAPGRPRQPRDPGAREVGGEPAAVGAGHRDVASRGPTWSAAGGQRRSRRRRRRPAAPRAAARRAVITVAPVASAGAGRRRADGVADVRAATAAGPWPAHEPAPGHGRRRRRPGRAGCRAGPAARRWLTDSAGRQRSLYGSAPRSMLIVGQPRR